MSAKGDQANSMFFRFHDTPKRRGYKWIQRSRRAIGHYVATHKTKSLASASGGSNRPISLPGAESFVHYLSG